MDHFWETKDGFIVICFIIGIIAKVALLLTWRKRR